MLVEQLVDFRDEFRRRFALLEISERTRQRQGGCRATAETYVERDVVALDDRDVLDDEADHAFAIAIECLRIPPNE